MDEFVNVKKQIEKDDKTLRKVKINFHMNSESLNSTS